MAQEVEVSMQNNVYECINISNVINKLHLRKTNRIGNYIYVTCPFCQSSQEKNGYMKVNTINNLYICDNCESSGTSIELYAKIKYISTKEAFKQLLKETPISDDIPYIYNNPIKDESYRNLVYTKFLEIQKLTKQHLEKLKAMNFTEEYIINNKFKSIENKPKEKKEICRNLIDMGLKLDGISGFYQDKDFKWTYKSHKGIFIPVTLDNKIQGLRIFLDNKYRIDTESIWFSSNNEYCGTKACNWLMLLKDENTSWLDLYNSETTNEIIVATEMILAHKIFNSTHKLVIGIPNNIDKDIILSIVNRMKIKNVLVYMDTYTIKHTSTFVYTNVIEFLQKNGINASLKIASVDNIEENIEKNVA